MNKRAPLISYLVGWALVAGCAIFAASRSGLPVWPVVVVLLLAFFVVNNALAYTAVSRRCRANGAQPPSYLNFLFRGLRSIKLNEAAPSATHVLVSAIAAALGGFLIFCGVALAVNATWSRITHPLVVASICLAPAVIGALCLWVAWRVFARRPHASNVA